MASATLKLDTSQWSRALSQLGKRGPIAVARGLNRTAMSERTVMARAVATDMGIKVGDAKSAIVVDKATAAKLTARLSSRGKRMPLINFRATGPFPSRGRGQGVAYTARGGRQRIANAFLAVVTRAGDDGEHAGHRGVFIRLGKKRLPIKQLYGPSIAHVFSQLLPVGEARRNEVLTTNVGHEIQFELSRLQA